MKPIYRTIFFLIAMSFFNACKPSIKTVVVTVTPLKESSLYNPNDVSNYLKTYKDTNKDLALDYYSKAKHTLVTPPQKTLYYLKRSLSLHPDFDNYKELAWQLYAGKDYKEMNDLYRMLVFPINGSNNNYVFSKPSPSIIIDYVVSNILAYNIVWNNKAEQVALTDNLGFKMDDIKEGVLKDPRITLTKPTTENRNALWALLTKDEKLQYYKDDSLPDNYVLHINDTATIFEIDKKDVQQFVYRDYAGSMRGNYYNETHGSYQESDDEGFGKLIMENNRYSKYNLTAHMMDYNFERSFSFNDSINVFIYAIDTSEIACPKDMRCIYHRLLTTTKKGAILDDKIVALQLGEQLSTLKFNHNKFTITYYKRYWEKPFTKNDFDNHLLNKTEELGDVDFEITPAGMIEKIRKPHRD